MNAPRTEALVAKRGEIRDHALYELAREMESALNALVETYAQRDTGTFGPEEPLWENARRALGK